MLQFDPLFSFHLCFWNLLPPPDEYKIFNATSFFAFAPSLGASVEMDSMETILSLFFYFCVVQLLLILNSHWQSHDALVSTNLCLYPLDIFISNCHGLGHLLCFSQDLESHLAHSGHKQCYVGELELVSASWMSCRGRTER